MEEILEERVVSSRGKHNPRARKRQFMRYPKKPKNAKTQIRKYKIVIITK